MHQTVLIVKKCKEDHTLMKVCMSFKSSEVKRLTKESRTSGRKDQFE